MRHVTVEARAGRRVRRPLPARDRAHGVVPQMTPRVSTSQPSATPSGSWLSSTTPFAPAPSFSPPTRSARSSGGWAATPDTPITNTVAAVSHELFAEVPEPSPQAR
jgi:hypothetical protein